MLLLIEKPQVVNSSRFLIQFHHGITTEQLTWQKLSENVRTVLRKTQSALRK